jgi:predicted Rossmann fold nucleotide-binding protein DprA/Smf involved in DNA uptake
MTDIHYLIRLSLKPGVGPVMLRKLLAVIGSPENIFSAGMKDLATVKAERGLCGILSREAVLPVHKILGILLSLELQGIVRRSNRIRFCLS